MIAKTARPTRRIVSPSIEPLEARIAPAFAAVVDLAQLAGDDGFRIGHPTPTSPDGFATVLGGIGDINNDGIDDVVVSAPLDGSGTLFVVFGSRNGFAANLDVTTLDGTNGFRIDGLGAGSLSGAQVSGIGDFNKDLVDDFVIGAPGTGSAGGAAIVIFGKSTPFASAISVSSPSGFNGIKFAGENLDDHAGASVGSAGDFNGDGYDDVIVGAPGAGSGHGAAYILFGTGATTSASVSLSTVNGLNGVRLVGEVDHMFTGSDVAFAGDVNRDGYDDVLVGSSTAGIVAGSTSYIVFGGVGNANAANRLLGALDGTEGFKIHGGAYPGRGVHLSAAGDINADGFDDFLISSSRTKDGATIAGAFAVFGHTGAFPSVLGLKDLDGSNGFRVDFGKFKDLKFTSVSSAGDINGDGIADFMVASAGFRGKPVEGVESDHGTSYVIFGHEENFSAVFDATTLEIGAGFSIANDPDTAFTVTALASAGDVNGDGLSDVIIGSSKPGQGGAGYVVFGQRVYVATNGSGDAVEFMDTDGDIIKIEAGGMKLSQKNFNFDPVNSTDELLRSHGSSSSPSFGLSFGPEFSGSTVKVKAIKSSSGDGLAHMGTFDASGVNFNKVKIFGSVDSFQFGDGSGNAVGTLVVQDLGPLSGVGFSAVAGGVGLFKVRGSMHNTSLAVGDGVSSGLKHMVVNGSVTDCAVTSNGKLKMTVFGNVENTTFDADLSVKTFTISGNLINSSIRAAGDGSSEESASAVEVIKKVTVSGRVENSEILAGYDELGHLVNGHASIGKIKVTKDWIASDLVAGVDAGADGEFGTADDFAGGGGGFVLASRIANVIIKGQVSGTAGGTDHFGFVAEEIGRFKAEGNLLVLVDGPNSVEDIAGFPFGAENDVTAREVAAPPII